MKKLMILITLLLFGLSMGAQTTKVRATYYLPIAKHNGKNPLVLADGSKVHLGKLKSGDIRWVSLSRDLLRQGYNLGDTIEVDCSDSFFSGIWIIHDKMGKRIKNGIDFLLHPAKKHHPPRYVTIRRKL